MKGLFDQYFSFKGQKYIFRQDVIDVKRAELEGLGDMLARDLARRNLQLEKAKNLHELLEEVSSLMWSLYSCPCDIVLVVVCLTLYDNRRYVDVYNKIMIL